MKASAGFRVLSISEGPNSEQECMQTLMGRTVAGVFHSIFVWWDCSSCTTPSRILLHRVVTNSVVLSLWLDWLPPRLGQAVKCVSSVCVVLRSQWKLVSGIQNRPLKECNCYDYCVYCPLRPYGETSRTQGSVRH